MKYQINDLSLFKNFRLIRRMPNVFWLLLLILIAGIAEGIGVAALVPMVSFLTENQKIDDIPVPFNFIPEVLLSIGIEPSFTIMLLIVLMIMLSSFLLIHLQDRAIFYSKYRFLSDLRTRASKSIFSARWEYFSFLSSGEVTNKVIHESDRGSDAILALVNMYAIMIQLIIYSIVAIFLSWKMFFIAAISILLASIAAVRLIRIVRKLGKKSTEINTLYSQQVVDFFRGMKLLKITNTEYQAEEKLKISNDIASNTNKEIVTNQSLMRFELQALISIALVVIIYLAVVILEIKVSVLLVFLFIVMRLLPKFSTLQGQYHNFSAYKPALQVVDDLISESESMKEFEISDKKFFNNIKEGIELKNVSYCYPESKKNSISDLSISIKVNSFVAIVGHSGSGKSTLLDLLIGLIEPSKGSLLIDGIELSKLNKFAYRRKIGFVAQDSVFFIGTIRENLCLDEEFNDNLVWDSLEVAQIKDFVSKLPNGLDTDIGEAGVKLSGGQRQRLSIARALIRKPSVLVLDEATSSLDASSEMAFQKAIEAVSQSYTLIVVAHRLSTVKKANLIYVLDDGKIVQKGDFNKLKNSKGVFLKLNEAQQI